MMHPEDSEIDSGTGEIPGSDSGQENLQQESSPVDRLRGNPAWGEIFDKVPAGLHEMLVGPLTKWEKNYSDLAERHSKVKDFENVDPQRMNAALGLMDLAEQNPRQIYDTLVETFKDEWGLTQKEAQQAAAQEIQKSNSESEVDLSSPFDQQDITQHPKVKELESNLEQMQRYLGEQARVEEEARVNAQLDNEIAALKQKYGNFDEGYVYTLAASGLSLEDSVVRYNNMVDGIVRQNRPGRPPILPASGGLPTQAVDVGALSDKDTRGLVRQFIKNSKTGD